MNNIIIELEKRISNLNEELNWARKNAKETIERVNDSHIGITKDSEKIIILLAKIDAYMDSIKIVKYFDKNKL